MIQIKRGKTRSWQKSTVKLAAGQPGYDKDKHKIKVGDGETLWSALPYVSGLHSEEILDSEANAKKRLNRLKDELEASDTTLITYGKENPDENTVGQIYLQQVDEPEVDYVIESGINGIWTYQKWKSGIAKCWCNYSFTTSVLEKLEFFYRSATISNIPDYPISFYGTPTEVATIQSSSGQVLLANAGTNTPDSPGKYTIISLVDGTSETGGIASANYCISLHIEGVWRENKNVNKN